MRLFHQLAEDDQHNAINYCLQDIIVDMLEEGVEVEAHSDEDKRRLEILIRVVAEAKLLPEEEQIEHVLKEKEAAQFCFDMAIDNARAAYYHPNEDQVIYYERLRDEYVCENCGHNHSEDDEDMNDDDLDEMSDLPEINPKPLNKKILN